MTASLVLDAKNIVGESLVWHPGEAALYWVDIVGRTIHRLDPATGDRRSWPTPELPTSIGLRKTGGFIVGLRQRVAFWTPGGAFETFVIPEPDRPDNRLNEGLVAPDGSFWVGTMQDNVAPDGQPKPMTADTGAVYRIAPNGTVTQLTDADFGITNTMVWTDDGHFIVADTTRNTLFRFRHDPVTGRLSDRTPWGKPLDRGLPDGSTRDRAGIVYNARVVGGSAIARIGLDGALLGYFDLPCSWPTSCIFGGPALTTLYVSSARFGMSAEHLGAHPLEGALFALDTATEGIPANSFG
ncbi:MAG: SMP-30/gluconolactonase/LRE family protein [Devosia sp.]|nr:SMP-30/gluconolactonase/LRE family protein [Devosia sp.]